MWIHNKQNTQMRTTCNTTAHTYKTKRNYANTILHSDNNTHAITQHTHSTKHTHTQTQHYIQTTTHMQQSSTHTYINAKTNANTMLYSNTNEHAITQHTHTYQHNHKCKYNITFTQQYTCNNTTHTRIHKQWKLQKILHSNIDAHAITQQTHLSKHKHKCKYNITFKQPYTCNATAHTLIKPRAQMQTQYYIQQKHKHAVTQHTHNYPNTIAIDNLILHSNHNTHAISQHTQLPKHNHNCKHNITCNQ